MTCTKGRIIPSPVTKFRLFADSGGFCQNPKCLGELFKEIDDEAIHVAEMAHVIGASDIGPRADARLTAEERGGYDNLILLCPMCHTIIDKAESIYPEGVLLDWKRNHKEKIASTFGCISFESRESAREAIVPLLAENRTIFNIYGPLTEERFNPESSMPEIWRRKIKSRIIPNNRKILYLCDANRSLMTPYEKETVEQFRQHVDDFEAKHIHETDSTGTQFPLQTNSLFS